MLYELNDWEDNGYHDSYFHKVVWDDEEKTVRNVEYGATAYVSAGRHVFMTPTSEIIAEAREWLKNYLKKSLAAADQADIDEPQSLEKGQRVKIKKSTKKQVKVSVEATCEKCDGTGHWINPRRTSDKRTCFACKGTGKGRGKESVLENGKKVYASIPAGTIGTVVWVGRNSFKPYFANGYKSLAEVSQALVKFETPINGMEVAYFDFEQLSLDRAPLTDEELDKRAARIADGLNFKPAVSSHGGWLTTNLAAKVWNEVQNSTTSVL